MTATLQKAEASNGAFDRKDLLFLFLHFIEEDKKSQIICGGVLISFSLVVAPRCQNDEELEKEWCYDLFLCTSKQEKERERKRMRVVKGYQKKQVNMYEEYQSEGCVQ